MADVISQLLSLPERPLKLSEADRRELLREDNDITISTRDTVAMDASFDSQKNDVCGWGLLYHSERESEGSSEASLVIFDVTEASWFSSCDCVPLEDLVKACNSRHDSCDIQELIELQDDTLNETSQTGDVETISTCLTSLSGPAGTTVCTMETVSGHFRRADGVEETCYRKSSIELEISGMDQAIRTPVSSTSSENERDAKLELPEPTEIPTENVGFQSKEIAADRLESSVRFREPIEDEFSVELQLPEPTKQPKISAKKDRLSYTKQRRVERLESDIFDKLSKDIASFDEAHKREKFVPVTVSLPVHWEYKQGTRSKGDNLKPKMDGFESRVDSLAAVLPKKRIVWPVCSKYPNCSICSMEIEEIDENVSQVLKAGFVLIPL